jgi:RND family efflux transporter MFP subunit
MDSHFIPLHRRLTLCAVVTAVLLSACSVQPPPPASTRKPVKIEVVGDSALPGADSFVGTLRARNRTALGFESSGRVAAIHVDVGNRVRAGQVLARLDESPARWQLEKAQADRRAAAATLAERRTHLRQQEGLARDEIISPAALQAAQSSYQQAVSQLDAATAAVDTARRVLHLTRVIAPFDAKVVARAAQPFTDVAAGQTILQLESDSALEVVAMLPDAVAATLKPGTQARATSGTESLKLTMERLSSHSDNGSLVQTIFRVHEASAGVRSGGAVSVELERKGVKGVTLPVNAVMAGVETDRDSVFIIAHGTETLQRRSVRTEKQLLPNGRIVISEGLQAGEQVVVAGTAFLTEGQAVVVHQPQTTLQGGRP